MRPDQIERLNNHQANTDTRTPKKVIKIFPSSEVVASIDDHRHLFKDIEILNVMLTNACNLSCEYCYEQHNTNFGRPDLPLLLEQYRFLRDYSTKQFRSFQFFGGEPLIYSKLILEFLDTYKDELQEGFDKHTQVITTVTNGTLFDAALAQQYFSYPFTFMVLSIDTLDSAVDHRKLTQEQIDSIVNTVRSLKEPNRVWCRCTLSEETLPTLEHYFQTFVDAGVTQFIIHPLVLDSKRGFIQWKKENWEKLQALLGKFLAFDDVTIKFAEGVGIKHQNNCMVGSDMIATDPSGDFSGCYFFNNQKTNFTGSTILGNLVDKVIYPDRYKTFRAQYDSMLTTEEQCISCDLQQHCYQCPAGNADVSGKLFRPDGMCQDIVRMYLKLRAVINERNFAANLEKMRLGLNDTPGFLASTLGYLRQHHAHGNFDPVGPTSLEEWSKELNCSPTLQSIYNKLSPVQSNVPDDSLPAQAAYLALLHSVIIK